MKKPSAIKGGPGDGSAFGKGKDRYAGATGLAWAESAMKKAFRNNRKAVITEKAFPFRKASGFGTQGVPTLFFYHGFFLLSATRGFSFSAS